MALADRTLDVRTFIDERPFSPFQRLVLILLFLIVFIDGFDTSAMGFVGPALDKAWGAAPKDMGPVMSSALIGLCAGALTAGPLADRFGRKVVLITAVVLFACGSLASSFADSLGVLTMTRIATGLGLGAAMPNATTLMSEYCPERRRPVLVTVMFCGFTFGGSLGGFIAAALIPAFGWQSVFIVGAVAPLLLALVLTFLLPESTRFMVVRGWPKEKITAILKRIAPSASAELDAAERFIVPEQQLKVSNPLKTILSPPLLAGTLLLWVIFFFGLMAIFLLTSWLPTLMGQAGFSLRASANITALYQLGGTVGAILVAWLMGKWAPHKALATSYVLAASFTILVGLSLHNVALLSFAVLGAGFFSSGAQTPMSALAAIFYPTQVRATGVSWMIGIGRFGGIIGAYIGAPLLAAGWGFTAICSALAIPLLTAAFSVAMKGVFYRDKGASEPFTALQAVEAEVGEAQV
jgi:AAHS family 4-hydroxybenzoate transporter-like MFS transporter